MYVEIKGVGFRNKGAELMLYAILKQLKQRLPKANLVVTTNQNSEWMKFKQLGFYRKTVFPKFGILFGINIGKYIPRKLRQKYRLVCHEEIDLVLDASGFAYSDQWGPLNCMLMARELKKWKQNNTKVILLPQALGPFNKKMVRYFFSKIAGKSDLIFPRDKISYLHVKNIAGESEKLIQVPDFTNLIEGRVPGKYKALEGRFCIIPNYRMIEKNPPDIRKKYLSFLGTCSEYLLQNDIKPFFLIHEGERDFLLAKSINKICNLKLEIIEEKDPIIIKGIISTCRGVVSSRFHGIVSALSQGVAVIATGWSHKYEMLFEEYGIQKSCISLNADEEEIRNVLSQVIDNDKAMSIRNSITSVAQKQVELSEMMWERVFKCIDMFEMEKK